MSIYWTITLHQPTHTNKEENEFNTYGAPLWCMRLLTGKNTCKHDYTWFLCGLLQTFDIQEKLIPEKKNKIGK